MGMHFQSRVLGVKRFLKQMYAHTRSRRESNNNVPKGHVAIYVGKMQKKRFVVPISYLNHPSFKVLLIQAEQEFGFNSPMGGLTFPCEEDAFIDLASRLHNS